MAKVGTASTSEAKIAVYLDQSLLPSVSGIDTAVRALVPKFNMAKVDENGDGDTSDTGETKDFSDYFEASLGSSSDQYYDISITGFDSASVGLAKNMSNGKSATAQLNARVLDTSGGSKDISGAAQQFKIAEITFNPKDSGVVGQTIAFEQINSQYAYNTSDALAGTVNNSTTSVLDSYEFFITF